VNAFGHAQRLAQVLSRLEEIARSPGDQSREGEGLAQVAPLPDLSIKVDRFLQPPPGLAIVTRRQLLPVPSI
jgi:hypothetical protein